MATVVLPSSQLTAHHDFQLGNQASSLLALLQEDDDALKSHALKKLFTIVDSHWAEACEHVSLIEALAEDSSFSGRHVASAVASLLYYHLEAYNDAVRCALAAGDYFDARIATGTHSVDASNAVRAQYVHTIVSHCIDEYIVARNTDAPIDPRLEQIVNQMFERCCTDGKYKQAVGIALEALRLDVITHSITLAMTSHGSSDADASSPGELLVYCIDLLTGAGGVSIPRAFRGNVLQALTAFYSQPGSSAAATQPTITDHASLARIYQALDNADGLADLLLALLRTGCAAGAHGASSPEVLLAFQIGLDAVENENQGFLLTIHNKISSADGDDTNGFKTSLSRLLSILDGSLTAAAYGDFLAHKCAADRLILKNTRAAVDASRNSVLHNSIVCSHAVMYCGTSIDAFLRDNLDWLARASQWNKFTACASLGSVHKGRLSDSLKLLDAYLPKEGTASSDFYAEGGALFALGLIHANRGVASSAGVAARPGDITSNTAQGAAAQPNVMQYLADQLRRTQNEVVQHGACLGLGTAAMTTGDEDLYNVIRELVYSDSAVTSEGAALGLGLLLTGRGGSWRPASADAPVVEELLTQAHDTDHEKVIRALGIAFALMCYAQEEAADALIDTLVRDKDAVLRYGGMLAIGLAYVGTGSNVAVKKLLHVAVSDVSDDVRRSAVMSLGFVLCRQWREVPTLVQQLAESYNPHVRYGAAMAVGIACAGSGLPDAVGLLEPLVEDSVDYVRQAALLALGLVLQQESGDHLPKAAEIRTKLTKIIADRHTSVLTKMGAILAQGIMDAGGRNAITSMVSRGGFVKLTAVVGMALWLQHWYWYPLMHFLSLAVSPTPLIGLVSDFRVAGDYKVVSQCKPSWFAYPPALEEKKEDKAAKVTTVELSITAKVKAKAAAKAKLAKQTSGGMDLDDTSAATTTTTTAAPAPDAAADATVGSAATETKEGEAEPKKEEKEATSFILTNPSRVTLGQAKFLDFDAPQTRGQRYVPVRPPSNARLGSGILMLLDTQPAAGEDESLKAIARPADGQGSDGVEPSAPEPFEWTVGEYY